MNSQNSFSEIIIHGDSSDTKIVNVTKSFTAFPSCFKLSYVKFDNLHAICLYI